MNCAKCGQKVKTLKVGDRVEAIGAVAGIDLEGRRGVVKVIDNKLHLPILVEFGKPFPGGHDGSGYCKDGYGRYGRHEDFEVIKVEKKARKKT